MKVILNARVAPELKNKLEELAKKEGITVSLITELFLKDYLKNKFKLDHFDSIIEFEKSMTQIDTLLEMSKQERKSTVY